MCKHKIFLTGVCMIFKYSKRFRFAPSFDYRQKYALLHMYLLYHWIEKSKKNLHIAACISPKLTVICTNNASFGKKLLQFDDFFLMFAKKLVKLPWVSLKWIPKECHYYQGPMLPMPSSLSNDDETSASDLNVLPGSKRKLREGFETSGLAKKLVFWSVIFFSLFLVQIQK